MVDTKTIQWEKFRENASIKNLSLKDVSVDLIKLEPNSQFDEHVHLETEWMYILKGSFSDKNGVYEQGCFVTNDKGSKHATKSGSDGCELLVIKLVS